MAAQNGNYPNLITLASSVYLTGRERRGRDSRGDAAVSNLGREFPLGNSDGGGGGGTREKREQNASITSRSKGTSGEPAGAE